LLQDQIADAVKRGQRAAFRRCNTSSSCLISSPYCAQLPSRCAWIAQILGRRRRSGLDGAHARRAGNRAARSARREQAGERFGSAANLNIHLHCLVLDGVYRRSEGAPVFHEVRSPNAAELETLLSRIIQRIMKLLTRTGYLIEEQGMPLSGRSRVGSRAHAPAGGGLHLSHCAGATRRAKSAEPANRPPPSGRFSAAGLRQRARL
jgi:hypothetical protein